MQYAILIYGPEQDRAAFKNPQEMEAMMGAYMAYTQALREAGVIKGGEALEPSSSASTIRIKDGQRNVQDGPFADTKEQLGGFYLIDVPDLDTAMDWAARCPGAIYGAVEVRPVMKFD